MAGALSIGGNQAPVPMSIPNVMLSQQDPIAGALSTLPAIPAAQPSALTQSLSDVGTELMKNPQEVEGALSRAHTAQDKATTDKLAAIQRAVNVLQSIGQQGPNMSQLAWGAGLLAPTQTGSLSESIGNGGRALYDATQKQQEGARQDVKDLLGLDTTAAQLPADLANANVDDVFKRLNAGREFGSAAQLGEYRTDLTNSRNIGNAIKLSTAQINANKGRYQYLGPSQDDPSIGLYLDKTTGATVQGDAVAAKQTDFQRKYDLAKAMFPNDLQKAYAAASGKLPQTPQQIKIAADHLAEQQPDDLMRSGRAPDDPDKFLADTSAAYAQSWAASGSAPSPGAQPPRPSTPAPNNGPPAVKAMPMPELKDRKPNVTTWTAPDKTVYLWTGRGWKPK
jgi:hypothetical protein